MVREFSNKNLKLHFAAARVLLLAFAVAPSIAADLDSGSFYGLLRDQAHASESELKLYSRPGGVLAKMLRNVRKGEVAAVGAVQIGVSIDFFIDRFRHIETFKKGPEVLSIGQFSSPPEERDLANLMLTSKEVEEIEECRPGKCALKLSAAMMNRIRTQTPAQSRGPELERKFRGALLEYTKTYMANGTPAMLAYADRDPPVQTSREFQELLGQFAWLDKYAPRLVQALHDSARTWPETDTFFYWSKEDFGLKPVTSVTHVLILRATIDGTPWAFIASKQIYADHYFDGSLGLTILRQESANPANMKTSVAYFNRSMTDGLRGWLASLERSIIERRVRAALAKNMLQMKDKLEEAYRDRRR